MTQDNTASTAYADGEEDPEWIGIWDRDNPHSVYARVPNSFRVALDNIPENIRHLDEDELLDKFTPHPSLGEARLKFWDLYKNTDTRLRMKDVWANRGNFYLMLENYYKFMWFLTPPADFLSTQKSVLERSLEVLHRFVSGETMWLETTTEKRDLQGKVTRTTTRQINTKAIEQARKVMESMTDRIHGAVAMNLRVQGNHQHLHAPTPAQSVQQLDESQILTIGNDEGGD